MNAVARRFLIATIPSLITPLATAAEIETRLAVKNIQHAEEIIATAIQVGDVAELKRQARGLVLIGGRISQTEEMEVRVTCAGSAGTLGNVAHGLSQVGQSRLIVAARRDLSLYRETMPKCEAYVGLGVPSEPNLRGP